MHIYTTDEVAAEQPYTPTLGGIHADSVEAAASGLLYHAGSPGPAFSGTSRRVLLPGRFGVTDEWGHVVCAQSAPCASFTTPAMEDASSVMYWLSKPAE